MNSMSQPFYLGKESPPIHFKRQLDGHHRKSECFAEETRQAVYVSMLTMKHVRVTTVAVENQY